MKSSSQLYACNCFATRQAARFITKMYESHLATVGLTSTQFSMLAFLDEAGEATMKDVCDMLVMERTSVVRALQPLERDGLVKIGADRDDPRKNIVRLTRRGAEKFIEAGPA